MSLWLRPGLVMTSSWSQLSSGLSPISFLIQVLVWTWVSPGFVQKKGPDCLGTESWFRPSLVQDESKYEFLVQILVKIWVSPTEIQIWVLDMVTSGKGLSKIRF